MIKNTSDKKLEFISIVHDLLESPIVKQMKDYNQHANTSCYRHSMYVAYYSYIICKKLNLDYISATRGAMLHDLFLYDWHTHKSPNKGLKNKHAFTHPKTALKNAIEHFDLNAIEKDVIENHMWPVTIKVPTYKETYVVTLADKYSACRETYCNLRDLLHTKKVYKYAYVFLSLIIFRIV